MSRQVSIQDSLTVNPSGIDTSASSYSSASNNDNAYTNVDSTTYSTISLTTGSGASSYVTYTFDTSDIPEDATIDSVECVARARVSSTSYISTATLQLYSGSTAKGSTTSFRSTSSTTNYTLSTGSWTRTELNDVRIRATATRGNSNTNRSASINFYGANLTINYSIDGIAYTIGATSNLSGVTVEPTTQEKINGEEAVITINAASIDDVLVTDNDVDVTNNLIRHNVPTGGTISAVPASYTTTGNISGTRYQSAVGYSAENPSTQTGNDYCSNSGSTATIYYKFNFDSIPDNATIESMSVRAAGHLESTSNSSEVAKLNTYYGTTAKGTEVSYTSTSNSIKEIDSGT